MNQEELKCCVTTCDKPLDQTYWDNQYQTETTGWDLGAVSPPLKAIIDAIEDKNAKILIPGAGNAYEASYLLEKEFTNLTVIDIAPTVVAALQKRFEGNPNISVIQGDFFQHQTQYDYILEQTFFCALAPQLRQKYTWKMHYLLKENGILTGVLFNHTFEQGPPFGGDIEEYQSLFNSSFEILELAPCQNSVTKRTGMEAQFRFQKKSNRAVNLYQFTEITCSGCLKTVVEKFIAIPNVISANMSSDFKEVLIVSTEEIPLSTLQNAVSYDAKYSIQKIDAFS